ncbi:zinc uptake system ATP-binding protein ZurA [Geobacter sp. OR-1]|uniref:metal ABC transporter ATP-binding protein n=1 Tax=Geobacter sp. OR-1 TaxID=1266765 RepID=UPI000543BD6A|nr:metal ABC transporter ATP-binding protein [Geobacter sp. OR-1]GAM09615.1 zinc uptake system ATP-binding protein ZurA [Geobacter sp. OR-1]
MPPVIEVSGLYCRYGMTHALSDVSFAVEAGDYLAVVGPNGSGKSTLVKALLGLSSCDEGEITLFGTPLPEFTDWRTVGYLPQNLNLFNPIFPATVSEVVGLGLLAGKRFPKRISRDDKSRIAETLEQMGIADLRHRLIGDLSGGQQQRVMLSRALVNQPKLLILDEPTAALDPETRDRFYALLTEINRNRGTTLILVTHDSATVGNCASKLLYLDKKLIFIGTFQEFCVSPEMTGHFGGAAQHQICRLH